MDILLISSKCKINGGYVLYIYATLYAVCMQFVCGGVCNSVYDNLCSRYKSVYVIVNTYNRYGIVYAVYIWQYMRVCAEMYV